MLTAAARALAVGDPLGALTRVALRDDAPALALRGIAMAQLGDLERSRELLKRASRSFGPREALARARCIVARADVALAARDLAPVRGLEAALCTLEAHGDRFNATHARLLTIRRALLLGAVDEAERALTELDVSAAPPTLVAMVALVAAGIALRRLRTRDARAALTRAAAAARRSGVAALAAEVEHTRRSLDATAARRVTPRGERALRLDDVERLLASPALVVDGCRRRVCDPHHTVALARRPVLFALMRTLAEGWPADVAREALIGSAFGARRPNDSHRARLRVELGRLRRELGELAKIAATKRGFVLSPSADEVVVLLPPIEGEDGALEALLADGEAWSTSALAMALGASQRTVQRALATLESSGRVRSLGRARARRWLAAPAAGFTTTLLLPASFLER